MNFTQKIYYKDYPLVVTADIAAYLAKNKKDSGFKVIEGNAAADYALALELLEQNGAKGVIIKDDSADAILRHINGICKTIIAGGGLVFNEAGAILMIYRRGKWDLPKGKLDEGERIDECALREVREETGLNHLQLADKLADTYHLYIEKGKNHLKHSVWYRMKGTSKDALVPQAVEDIHKAEWVDVSNLHMYMSNTYETIKDVIAVAGLLN